MIERVKGIRDPAVIRQFDLLFGLLRNILGADKSTTVAQSEHSSSAAVIPHASTTGRTANDHHAQLHAASHAAGQPDELDYSDLDGLPTLGTAAALDVAAAGDAAAAEVVLGADTRLTDARAPTGHAGTHATGESDALAPGDIGAATAGDLTTHEGLTTTVHGGIVADTDARLTDARDPTTHGNAAHSDAYYKSGDAIEAATVSTDAGTNVWDLGGAQAGVGLVLLTTGYLDVTINGIAYKVALVT
jgi:hypothetical protein